MDHSERDKLIALYRDGYRAIVEALHNVTDEEMAAQPAPASGRRATSSITSPTAR